MPFYVIDIKSISIHALREEGDKWPLDNRRQKSYFYPRPPRGGRPASQCWCWASSAISIHALREEGDLHFAVTAKRRKDFYPRPPRGGRHEIAQTVADTVSISIHALREEGDTGSGWLVNALCKFLSTPSARRATMQAEDALTELLFLSTPSARRATQKKGSLTPTN